MIKKLDKDIKDSQDALAWAHPLVKEWFLNKIGIPTEPQALAWPLILAKNSSLIAAPTGSGKTLTAFLVHINHLIKKSLSGTLSNKTEILYVSPLKALNNDIQKNLMRPINEIEALASKRNLQMAKISVAVRTGDTKQSDRIKMLKHSPHILVTTPESLYILLTAEKSREMLSNIKTVIIDEIHAMVNNKRGTHLALSLERLEAITHSKPIRIGLSATQKPIETIAHFLSGSKGPKPKIVNPPLKRKMELQIALPNTVLGPIASNDLWDEIYSQLADLAEKNTSTLVFVNTRRLAERISHHLAERLGDDKVAAHHGSLSMKLRHAAEHKLKEGELKVLVATASLELGIDIGDIDLVCQIGTPRSINAAVQRFGRSGHWHDAVSKGIFFPTTRDELFECAALIYAIRQGELDEIILPKEPLDILTQQIIAACATGDWKEKDLYKMIIKAYPYRDLSYETFDNILEMLSQGIAGTRGRYGCYLHRDKINGVVKARRGSRLISITSGGAIPDNGLFNVVVEPEGITIGTLDEDFAIESNKDDIILLGTSSWKVKRIESVGGKVIVEDAHGAPPSVPFWRGEAPGRTKELSYYVSLLRITLDKMLEKTKPAIIRASEQPNVEAVFSWLSENCGLNDKGAEQAIDYLLEGRAVLGEIPSQETVIAERFFDETGGMQLIIHAPFGMQINKAWGMALRKKFCRSFNFELQAAATDNGLNISLAEQHSFPLADVFHFLNPKTLKEVLVQAILQSPIFKTRWRWTATRSLALVRFRYGKKTPPNIQRILSEDLLAAIFPESIACQDNLGGRDIELPSHPLIDEAMKDALNEALDVEGLISIINKIVQKEIHCIAVDSPIPSVFSAEILNANPYAFLDDAPLEERRARAVDLRRVLPQAMLENIGRLDPLAIEEVQLQAWPDVRNADELQDSLQTFIAFPKDQSFSFHSSTTEWQKYFEELKTEGRVGEAIYSNKTFWFALEKINEFSILYPTAEFQVPLKNIDKKTIDQEQALLQMIRGWISHIGPTTAAELQEILCIPAKEINQALLSLENTGFILRGHFRFQSNINFQSEVLQIEWCERRLLARIHRLTIGRLRKEIEPVTITQFINWLFKWQHVNSGTKLHGEQGLLEVIKQLQGFEIPANAWEKQIFARRLHDFDKNSLDQLCLTGRIGWGRFSEHSSLEQTGMDSKKRTANPTSTVPISFFVYEGSDWLPNHELSDENLKNLSPIAKQIYEFLHQKGASFFHQIAKGTHHLDSEIENGLWELVTIGAITADSFDNLRALVYPKRRQSRMTRLSKNQFSTGRWSIFRTDETLDPSKRMESLCWMLLKRYGVVFRDLIAREKNIPRWRELLTTFRRLEDRGEIRGGRFVEKIVGEQFAIPYAVDSLRSARNQTDEGEHLIEISPVDPLNLIGILLPGSKISPFTKKLIPFLNGKPQD